MHPAFAAALAARRDQYNARFALARRLRPELDGEVFKRFFASAATPLVEQVHALDPAAVDALVSTAYDIALELVAQRLTGPVAAQSVIGSGWIRLAAAAAPFLCEQPRWPLVAISNALLQLGALGQVAVARWLELLVRARPHCGDLAQWLQAGQVAAWLCGMAQYRGAALDVLAALPEAVQQVLLQLPDGVDPAPQLSGLRRSPWFLPGAAAPVLQLRRLGGFSGFGGPFARPPQVACKDGELYVRAGEQCWTLLVDAFGHHLARIAPAQFIAAAAQPVPLPAGWRLQGSSLHAGQLQLDLGGAGALRSHACNAHTLLVSHAASHRLSVIAVST